MAWFTLRYRLPWSLLRYLDVLHTCGVLRQGVYQELGVIRLFGL